MQDFLQNFEILYKNLSFFRDGNVIMIAIGCLLIYLASAKDMEPSLLLPMGFGTILVNIPFSDALRGPIMELYNALQNKTVDGQENPFLSIASMKLFEVQNYMVVSGHSYLEYIMTCSKGWWDGLDADTQALIEEVVIENQQFCYDRLQEYNTEYYNTIASGDITIIELTAEERQAFLEASEPVYEIFGEQIGTDLLGRVREFLADPANQ